MVSVRPFRGFLANKQLAQKIISPPYDVIDSAEARRMAEGNDVSFLHVNKPEIDLPTTQDPYGELVYKTGHKNLHSWIDNGLLQKDDMSRFYIYAQKMSGITQMGLVSASSVLDYEKDIIKKHEKTLQKKEKDRTMLTDVQSANVGPVFLTYRNQENTSIAEKMAHITATQEAYSSVIQKQDATDVDVEHSLWRVDENETKFFMNEFGSVPNTYVADGHHRSAAAYNVGKIRRERALAAGKTVTGEEDFNFFMSIIYPDTHLRILEYNRVIRSINDLSEESFMDRIQENFATLTPIADGASHRPVGKHQLTMLMKKQWYTADIREDLLAEANKGNVVNRLDVQMFSDKVLRDILGITDVRNDQRVDFVGGSRGLEGVETRCNEDSIAGFVLHPIVIDDLLQTADANLAMPPKCTWFEPKPRSGFVVRLFDQ